MVSVLLELMKFFRFCQRKSCDKDVDPVHPKMQVNVDTVVQPCDGKVSASSAATIESESSQSAAKIAIFELVMIEVCPLVW